MDSDAVGVVVGNGVVVGVDSDSGVVDDTDGSEVAADELVVSERQFYCDGSSVVRSNRCRSAGRRALRVVEALLQ